jgi:hypothetical protein
VNATLPITNHLPGISVWPVILPGDQSERLLKVINRPKHWST